MKELLVHLIHHLWYKKDFSLTSLICFLPSHALPLQ